MGAFGEKLRKQREQRGLALDAISNTTKISTRMLRALEDEHFDQLPGGVFNKGFVRAYARQVGLDEEEAITDYLTALRESQIQQQSILPDFRAPAGKPSPPAHELHPEDSPDHHPPGADGSNDHGNQLRRDRRKEDRRHQHEDPSPLPDSTTDVSAATPPAERFSKKYPAGNAQPTSEPSAQIPWGKLAFALLLVTLALAFWNFRRRREPTAAPQPALASNPSPTSAPAPLSAPTSVTTQPSSPGGSLTVGQSSPAGTLSAGKLSPGIVSTNTAPPTETIASTTTPKGTTSPSPAASTTVLATGTATKPTTNPATATPPVAKSATPAAAAKPPATFTLLIRAEKTTWVSIVADGKPVAEETLIAPAHTSIRASHEIYVRAGNAAGISFLLNGKEFPAQGNDGEVKTYVFDATTVRVLPPTQSPAANR